MCEKQTIQKDLQWRGKGKKKEKIVSIVISFLLLPNIITGQTHVFGSNLDKASN